jgi:hypothetical protein
VFVFNPLSIAWEHSTARQRLALLLAALLVLPMRGMQPEQPEPVKRPSLDIVVQLPPAIVKELQAPKQPVPVLKQYRQAADAVLLAYRDIQRLPKYIQRYTRYFWVWDTHPLIKQQRWIAVSGQLNALSLSQRIVPATIILDDGSVLQWQMVKPDQWARVVLLSCCLLDYNQTPEQFDKLGNPNLEPIFHTFNTESYPAGRNTDGSRYEAGEYRVPIASPWLYQPLGIPDDERVQLSAKKIYTEAVNGLRNLTYCETPIVESRNFIWQTGINFLRPAGYYSWLGIKDRDSFDKLVRRQPGVVVLRDAVSDSGVSKEAREIQREGRGDGYWETHDQVDNFAQGNRNPLVIRPRNTLKFDGFETFGRLDNGWWATGAFKNDNKKGGTALDSAPDGIGYNHGTLGPTNDGKIHVGLGCFACHDMVAGRGGLQPFAPYFRNKYSVPGKLGAVFASKQDEFEYLTPFDAWADTDRRIYISTVLQATGVGPSLWASAMVDAFHSWDKSLSLEDAAAELGVRPEAFVAALEQYVTQWGALPDTVVDAFMAPQAQRTKIGRSAWTEFYPSAQLVMRGLPVDYHWPANKKK